MLQMVNTGMLKVIRRHLLGKCAWCGSSAERPLCETCRGDMLS